MELQQLAIQYRESASLIKGRINILKETLQKEKLCEMEKFRLRVRIDTLNSIQREVTETAVFMERYYDRRYPRRGKFSI